MYEFNKKEIRKKFKDTEYGKKTNKWLYISLSITALILVLAFVFGFLAGIDLIKLNEEDTNFIITIADYLFFIGLITTCYFDGKRDGAIEQFKKSIEK